jgi:glutathione synthase/RimK-type ligase-like ATP-grasp enzyme
VKKFIVVDKPADWTLGADEAEVISVDDYLAESPGGRKNLRVFNLAGSYRYQSRGYYVSLLAEARGHKVIPGVKTIQELNAPRIVRFLPADVDELVQHSLRRIRSNEFTLTVYFGENLASQHARLAFALYQLFQAPFLRFRFRRGRDSWSIRGVRALAVDDIPESHVEFVRQAARRYFSRKRFTSERRDRFPHDLAILVNPDESEPPSDRKAIQNFVQAARREGFSVELIGRADYHRLAEFDALFIRETTSVNHHTWRFSLRAQSEGLAVIDDPDSILKCANKVFLAEALRGAHIPIPETVIVNRDNYKETLEILGLPCVLKRPDSSFSQGVEKASSREEFKTFADEMLSSSDLLIAQEYIPTEFDWRIGVLEGRPLFACKYFMARGHWQIYNWDSKKRAGVSGGWETLAVDDAPSQVVDTALAAARLVGNGLYGVDLKDVDGRAIVIEINDNPSIESRVEDKVLGNELYATIMRALRRRVEARLEGRPGETG